MWILDCVVVIGVVGIVGWIGALFWVLIIGFGLGEVSSPVLVLSASPSLAIREKVTARAINPKMPKRIIVSPIWLCINPARET